MKRYRLLDVLYTAILLATVLVTFLCRTTFRLEFKEQISIFLFGADRISWYLSNPAVIASIAGDWLTQFYINGTVGAVLSTLLLVLTVLGLARFFRQAVQDRPACLILLVLPVLLEGYFIPFPNYPVSATIGLAVAVWTGCLLAYIKDSKYSSLIYGLAVPVMYVAVGMHAFTLALMLGFLKRRDGVVPMLCLVAGIIVMLFLGRLYNLSFTGSLIWPVCPGYINPANALLLIQPWLVLVVLLLSLLYDRIKESGWTIGVYTFVLGICCSVFWISGKSELEKTVKIGTLAYRNKWKEVKEMAAEPGVYSSFYRNLCNAREGRLADELLEGQWGYSSDALFLSTGRGDPYFSMIYFSDALLEIGDVSQATDCSLLAQTIMPGHYSTRLLRRLAQIAIVTGDYDVATKYLDILSRTRNHKAWARNLLECIDSEVFPDEYMVWRSRTVGNDHFFAQGDIRSSLAIIASESPYNKVAIDYLLCSYLLDKNVNTFISLYDRYYLDALDQIVDVPLLYQEALLVNVTSRESLKETVEKYHISTIVANAFTRLMDARAQENDPSLLTQESLGSYWHYIMAVRFNSKQ